jgi:hypothetical protein
MISHYEVLKKGGNWIGSVRRWVQSKKRNGETITWGSNEEIKPAMTMLEVETIGAIAVAAYMNEELRLSRPEIEILKNHQFKQSKPTLGSERIGRLITLGLLETSKEESYTYKTTQAGLDFICNFPDE